MFIVDDKRFANKYRQICNVYYVQPVGPMDCSARLFELGTSSLWLGPTGLVHMVRPINKKSRGVCHFCLLRSNRSFDSDR